MLVADAECRPSPELERALAVFLEQRPRLVTIARRVVGDASTAEDVVQEAWLRWQRTSREEIRNPAAFLTTTTVRLAINVVQSARHRHETPTQSPALDRVSMSHDPTRWAERSTEIDQLLGLLVARLSPTELAAYVLRKAFDYPSLGIAGLLRTNAPNARQLVRRAQTRLVDDRARNPSGAAPRALLDAFLTASRTGELERLERVLTGPVHTEQRVTTRPAPAGRGRGAHHYVEAGTAA